VVWDVDVVPNTSFDLWTRRTLRALQQHRTFQLEAWPGWQIGGPLNRLGALVRRHLVLPLELQRRHARVLHAPTVVAPLWGRTPLVVTVYDLILLRLPAAHPSPWIRYYRWLIPRVLQRAAAIVAISESTRAEITGLGGVDANKVRVVYPGVDHGVFCPSPMAADAWRTRYGVAGLPYIVYVGQLAPRRGRTGSTRSARVRHVPP